MSQSRHDGLFLVDYHAHILPGCDHGSDGTETSKRQLEAAKAAGIETVCATSHFYPDKENLDRFLARRTECFEKLKAVRGNFPEIRLGAEVLLCEGFEHFENIEKLCLSGTNKLLFEMPMYRWSSSLRNTVLELNTRRDIRLVMAHADRYPVNDVREFIRAGIPLQLNVDSFLSFRKRAKSLEWIDNGCAVRIGSDIHGAKKLYAPWLKCKKYILKKLDEKI